MTETTERATARNRSKEQPTMTETTESSIALDVNELLAAVANQGRGGDLIVQSEAVRLHEDPKEKSMVLPQGMTFQKAGRILGRLHEESETPTTFEKSFPYRRNDGLYAAAQVMKEMFGVSVGARSWFKNAARTEIEISPGVKVMVPSGDQVVPHMDDAAFHLGSTRHPEYGVVFWMHITAKKKYEDDILRLFTGIEDYLSTRSIYRGQALHGADELDFLDMKAIDPNKIVFAEQVHKSLEAGVWGYMRHTESFVQDGASLRKSTLMYGPYGTGKTSAGFLTAVEAVANGWTFISADPKRDDIQDVLRTASLYQPAVVFVEDVDGETSKGDAQTVSKLLDLFDGITSKGGQLLMLMTTNHAEKIHKGMLRPGRLDMIIEVDSLDDDGIQKLVQAYLDPSQLADKIDWEAVAVSMANFQPAFVVEAVSRARAFAINSNGGTRDYVLSTEDLVYAATSLHAQLGMLNGAGEGELPPTLDVAMGESMKAAARQGLANQVSETLSGARLLDEDDDYVGRLVPNA